MDNVKFQGFVGGGEARTPMPDKIRSDIDPAGVFDPAVDHDAPFYIRILAGAYPLLVYVASIRLGTAMLSFDVLTPSIWNGLGIIFGVIALIFAIGFALDPGLALWVTLWVTGCLIIVLFGIVALCVLLVLAGLPILPA